MTCGTTGFAGIGIIIPTDPDTTNNDPDEEKGAEETL